MRRRVFVAAVVLLAVLVATAPGAQAANVSGELAVASKHTTDSDFAAAPTLDNVSVEGTGTDAAVVLGQDYNPVDDEGDGTVDVNQVFVGDDGSDNTRDVEVRINPNESGTVTTLTPVIASTSGSDYGFTVDIYIVQETPDTTYGEGTLVKSGWDPDFSTGEQEIQLDSAYDVSAGTDYTVEFVVSGSDNDGTADYLTLGVDDSASSTWYTHGGNSVDRYGDLFVNVATGSGQYIAANHSAEGVAKAWTNLTLQNASATVEWEYHDGSSWQVANSSTYTSSGNKTLSVSGESDAWRVDVAFDAKSGTTDARLHDDGVLFDPQAASGSDAEPTGEVESFDGDISIQVNDSDFGLAQGDSVTVTAANQDGQINQTTISSNQTVSFDYDALAGTNNITWTLTDAYGETTTVDQDFSTPAVLEVRDEIEPRNLINSSDANVTITFFGDDTVEKRDVTDGTANLSGLPADEEFVAVVEADDYHARRIIIPSLFEQQVAYLLPKSATSADIVFELDDRTGDFPARDTRLYIEKAINVSGSTEYRVISADTFGSSGEFVVTLQDETRYRLRVQNDEGDTRVLGAYTTAGDDVATLPIGELAVGSTVAQGSAFETSFETGEDGQKYARVTYRDPDEDTDRIEYDVEVNNTVVATVNESGPFGDYRATHPVDNDTTAATINYSIDRGGETIDGSQRVADVPAIATQWPIDAQVLSLMSWLTIFAVTGLVVIWDARLSTLVGVGAASILTAIGAVQIPSMALGLAGVLAVVFNIGRGGGR